MEKVLITDSAESTATIKGVRGLKGARVSFQICVDYVRPTEGR